MVRLQTNFLSWVSSGMAPNNKTFRALSKLKWFSDKSMYEAKLVTGVSELVEPVKILAGSWAEVSSPREIAGGALRGIILWQKLALPLAGLKLSRIILLLFNGRGPSCWSPMERRSFSWQGIAAELPG